jgi:hypothetical protein
MKKEVHSHEAVVEKLRNVRTALHRPRFASPMERMWAAYAFR